MAGILFAALVLTAICSGTETAFSSAGRIQAWSGKRDGRAWAGLVVRLLESPELFLTTTLVGTNVGTVLASVISISITRTIHVPWSESVTVILTALIILVFAEVIPKQLFFLSRDRIVYPLAPLVQTLRFLFLPLIFLVGFLSRLIVGKRGPSRFIESREEVKSFLISAGNTAGLKASRILDLASATAELYMEDPYSIPSVRLGTERGKVLSEVLRTDSEFLLVWETDGETLLGYVRSSELVRHTGSWNLSSMTEGLPYFELTAVPGRIIFELRRVNAPAGVILGPTGQPEGIVTVDRVLDCILGYD